MKASERVRQLEASAERLVALLDESLVKELRVEEEDRGFTRSWEESAKRLIAAKQELNVLRKLLE